MTKTMKDMFWMTALVLLAWAVSTVHAATFDEALAARVKITRTLRWRYLSVDDMPSFGEQRAEALSVKRRALILSLSRLARQTRREPDRLEVNLRLGKLYIEEYYARLFRAQQAYERKVAEEKRLGRTYSGQIENRGAREAVNEARWIYKRLLGEYPKDSRRDEMLYFLAVGTVDSGQVEEGLAYYRQLLDASPRSRYASDALIQLADHDFEKNKVAEAEKYYDRVIAGKDESLLAYAIYKKAWCRFDEGKSQDAVVLFKRALRLQDAQPSSTLNIRNEALRDLAIVYANRGAVEEAATYFEGFGPVVLRTALETIAGLYLERAEYPKAIALYERLLSIDSSAPKNPQYDLAVVKAMELADKKEAAMDRLFKSYAQYVKGTDWYAANAGMQRTAREVSARFEEAARRYATEFHAEAQKTKRPALYTLARSSYEHYLADFPRTPYSAQMRFSLAEVLFRDQDFVDAANNYYEAAQEMRPRPMAQEALRDCLFALDNELNRQRAKQGLPGVDKQSHAKLKDDPDRLPEIVPLDAIETRFVDVGEEYQKTYPQAAEVPDLYYEQGYLFYVHYDFNRAYGLFQKIWQRYPSHPTFQSAVRLAMDILNRRKDYAALIGLGKEILGKASAAGEFREEVASIVRHSELKRIQQTESAGRLAQAAAAYLEYTREYGAQDETLYEQALYNAGVDFVKAGAISDAVGAQERFLRRFPKSSHAGEVLLAVAKNCEQLADFGQAAAYFEEFADRYPKHPQTANALRLAGLYYQASGESEKAEMAFLARGKRFPAKLAETSTDLIDLYEAQGEAGKAILLHQKAANRRDTPITQAIAHRLSAVELKAKASGRDPESFAQQTRLLATAHAKELKRTTAGAVLLAKLAFWAVQPREKAFYAFNLSRGNEVASARLKKKIALLEAIDKAYVGVAAYGGEWGLGALYRTAAAYHKMAMDVQEAPVPTSLSGEELDHYRAQVNSRLVKPFQDKALNLAVRCLEKAEDGDLLAEWTPRCFSLAHELDPDHYDGAHTLYLAPYETAVWSPTTRSTASLGRGDSLRSSYPFFSSQLFQPAPLAEEGITEEASYLLMSEARRIWLDRALEAERPSGTGSPSFAYLNLLRIVSPDKAIPLIREAIRKHPEEPSLVNLLGLAFLEGKRPVQARITWLSLVARGVDEPALWNNLGVIAAQQGHESEALEAFQHASSAGDGIREAWSNLGFIALKYHNPHRAKQAFEAALGLEKKDAAAGVGWLEARLQEGEGKELKDSFQGLVLGFGDDPYARLAAAHFLMEVESQPQAARQFLQDFLQNLPTQGDAHFQRALRESAQTRLSGELVSEAKGDDEDLSQ